MLGVGGGTAVFPGRNREKNFSEISVEEGCRGSDGSARGVVVRQGGAGNQRDIPGKMIIRSWKNFWHEKREKVATRNCRRNAFPQCQGYRVIYRQILDGGSVSAN